MQLLASQIQEAIFEAQVLGIIRLAEHRQGQFLGRSSVSSAFACTSTPPVGRLALTVSAVRSTTLPSMRMTLSARVFSSRGESRRRRGDHDLGEAEIVAKVDEQEPAMVALAVHPARKTHGLAGVIRPQLAASMGAIDVHCRAPKPVGTAWGSARARPPCQGKPGCATRRPDVRFPRHDRRWLYRHWLSNASPRRRASSKAPT